MEEKLLEIFPEFKWINDETLRQSCIKTWIQALKKGGWDIDSLRAIPFVVTELKDCPVLLIDHVKNVTQTAARIANFFNEKYDVPVKVNCDIVVAGALLHDVGKLLEYKRADEGYAHSEYGDYIRHPVAGAILAAENGVPERVIHIIATHSFEGEKSYQTKESYIVKTSDWLNFNYLSFTYPNQMKH